MDGCEPLSYRWGELKLDHLKSSQCYQPLNQSLATNSILKTSIELYQLLFPKLIVIIKN